MKWISKGADFRLQQLMNKLNDSAPRYNNMVIVLVQWFTLTGSNYLLLFMSCSMGCANEVFRDKTNFLHLSDLSSVLCWS